MGVATAAPAICRNRRRVCIASLPKHSRDVTGMPGERQPLCPSVSALRLPMAPLRLVSLEISIRPGDSCRERLHLLPAYPKGGTCSRPIAASAERETCLAFIPDWTGCIQLKDPGHGGLGSPT